MAIGRVGYSGRAIKEVAPNSPKDMVNAKIAATSVARPIIGISIYRRTVPGDAPNTAAAWRIRGRMLRSAGVKFRTTNGKATNVCASGTRIHDERKSNGGLSSATINPSPRVTALVPNGNINIASSARLRGESYSRD